MATTLLGNTTIQYQGQATITGYIVLEEESGFEVKEEMVENGAGADIAALVQQRKPTKRLRLIVTTGTVTTDFPTGLLCTIAAYSDYRVRSAPVPKTKGAQIIQVDMVNDFA